MTFVGGPPGDKRQTPPKDLSSHFINLSLLLQSFLSKNLSTIESIYDRIPYEKSKNLSTISFLPIYDKAIYDRQGAFLYLSTIDRNPAYLSTIDNLSTIDR